MQGHIAEISPNLDHKQSHTPRNLSFATPPAPYWLARQSKRARGSEWSEQEFCPAIVHTAWPKTLALIDVQA